MEPGHEDREDTVGERQPRHDVEPQWSPAMKTGKTTLFVAHHLQGMRPQWSPAMKTGKTTLVGA